MGWKLNLGIGGAVVGGSLLLLALYQNQIRNAFFTAGQTVGQGFTGLAQGFLEPFQSLKFPDFGQTPSATNPLYVPPPVIDPKYVPGSQPPAGSTPPKDEPKTGGNGVNGNAGMPPSSPASPPPSGSNYFVGLTENIYTDKPTTTTTTQITAPKKGPLEITINTQTATSYTKFLAQITKAIGDTSSSAVSAINQAWQAIQSGKQVIVIPGLPVITSPVIPAFAEKPPAPTKNYVPTQDKKNLGMGATSYKPVSNIVTTIAPGTYWNPAKIEVPKSAKPTAKASFVAPTSGGLFSTSAKVQATPAQIKKVLDQYA